MLWMFNNVVLDLCRLVWRHFPHWYRFQNNRNIYRRSSTSMLHRHLSTIARKRQTLNFTYRFFVVRPHTLGRPSLRQSSHHHLFFPSASVLILRHNTWMLPCFLSKQGCDSTHWAERESSTWWEPHSRPKADYLYGTKTQHIYIPKSQISAPSKLNGGNTDAQSCWFEDFYLRQQDHTSIKLLLRYHFLIEDVFLHES